MPEEGNTGLNVLAKKNKNNFSNYTSRRLKLCVLNQKLDANVGLVYSMECPTIFHKFKETERMET